MKTTIRRLSALGLALLPLAAARAELDTAIVPADSRWVVSLDLDAFRESPLGQELLGMVELPEVGISDTTGLRPDPQKLLATIGNATAFGANLSGDPAQIDGVLVLQGTADLGKLAEAYIVQAMVAKPDAIRQSKDLPFDAYAFPNGVIIAFPEKAIVLVGRSKTQLVKALEVLRRHTGSLARTPSPLSDLLPQADHACVVAACMVPDGSELGGKGPQARVLKMASAGSVAIATNAQSTSARIVLAAASEEAADKLQKIVQGVAAMASLTETDDKQLGEFLRSAQVVRDDKRVILNLDYPTDGIVRMVKNIVAPSPTAEPHRFAERPGALLAKWTADQTIGQEIPTKEGLTTHTIENVELKTGTVITLTGQRDQGEHARIDCVEIIPAAGGQPLRFEAENMNFTGYRAEAAPFASRGRLIIATHDTGTARFEFPGADGTYTVNVSYIDEADGKAHFAVTAKSPAQPAADE